MEKYAHQKTKKMAKKPYRLYFGRPVNTYDTPLEKWLTLKIMRTFPESIIENPNQLHHQEGYKKWKENKGNGMRYFFEEVLPKCSGGIFLPFSDGLWGAGVYGELKPFLENGRTAWEINHHGMIRKINSLEEIRALTIKETRERVYRFDAAGNNLGIKTFEY